MEIIKTTCKISTFTFLFHVIRMFEYSRTNQGFDSTNLWRYMIRRIHDSATNIRIFGFSRIKMPFTVTSSHSALSQGTRSRRDSSIRSICLSNFNDIWLDLRLVRLYYHILLPQSQLSHIRCPISDCQHSPFPLPTSNNFRQISDNHIPN